MSLDEQIFVAIVFGVYGGLAFCTGYWLHWLLTKEK